MENQNNPETSSTSTNLPQLLTNINEVSEKLKELALSGDLTLAVALEGRQIGTYIKQQGKKPIRQIIALWISDMAASFNIGKNLNEEQIADLANEIMNEKWFYKVDEIFYFLKRCKIGAYGKVYDRLDMATVFEWLEGYNKQRDEEINKKRPVYEDSSPLLFEGLRQRFPDAPYFKETPGETNLREKLSDPEYQDWKNANQPKEGL